MYVENNGISIVGVLLIIIIGISIFVNGRPQQSASAAPMAAALSTPGAGGRAAILPTPTSPPTNHLALAPIYDTYEVTQGVHGASYGHMAVDLAAGRGASIKSPITGVISDRFIDIYGNTTLVIENNRYQITLLHGRYTVDIGDNIRQGEQIGTEGNFGYVKDMRGNLCTNRDCGYHTHLNVYDKVLGRNVNPLPLMTASSN